MRYVLGIDSGGSKYLARACTLDGEVIAEHTGDPAPHYRFPREEVIRRIEASIDACLAEFGGTRRECEWLVCGTTGIDSPGDKAIVEGIYGSLEGFDCPIECVNDAEVAHFAVTGGTGAVVIAGTGSVAFGRNAQGETARSGGWPVCIFGDEGSGTWISYQALRHLGMWFDDRVPSSELTDALRSRLEVRGRDDLMRICSGIELMTWQNPGVSALVDAAAEAGDPAAIGIITRAAEQTFALADSVVGKLALADEERFTVGAWGSAIVKSRLHFRLFRERFEHRYDNVSVRIADTDAAMGACRLALRALQAV